MSHVRTLLLSALMAATTIAGHGAPAGASATVSDQVAGRRPTTISFTAIGYGSGPYDVTTGEYHTTGAFIATRLGAGTLTADSDPNLGFTAVETTSRGDQIFITNDPTNAGPALPTYCPTSGPLASSPYAGGEFITGGTGRYANASGYITYSGCLSITPDDTLSTGYRFTFTFVDHGTITA